MRTLIRSVPLFPLLAAGLLAGCNSLSTIDSRGPWGRYDVNRASPQYSSPWRPRSSDERPHLVSEIGQVSYAASPIRNDRPSPVHPTYERVAGLPADPQPPSSAVAISKAEVADPAPVETQRVQQQENSARVSAPAEAAPGVFTAPRRATSYAGTWQAKDDKGRSCVIHLSSVASLDLYKASTSKCSDESLRQVNMWRFEGTRISLYSRGTETAQLEGTEASLTGALKPSGAALRMTR